MTISVNQTDKDAARLLKVNVMNNVCYGVLGRDGGFIETSSTEKGAKRKATNDGYSEVYAMHRVSWAVWLVAEKKNVRWI